MVRQSCWFGACGETHFTVAEKTACLLVAKNPPPHTHRLLVRQRETFYIKKYIVSLKKK